MKLIIEIDMGNAAFDAWPCQEAARILRDLAARIDAPWLPEAGDARKLYDVNGNSCGFAKVEES